MNCKHVATSLVANMGGAGEVEDEDEDDTDGNLLVGKNKGRRGSDP